MKIHAKTRKNLILKKLTYISCITCTCITWRHPPTHPRGCGTCKAVLRVEGNLAAKAAELGPGLALLAHPLDLGANHQVPATVKSDLRECRIFQNGLLLRDNGLVGVSVLPEEAVHDLPRELQQRDLWPLLLSQPPLFPLHLLPLTDRSLLLSQGLGLLLHPEGSYGISTKHLQLCCKCINLQRQDFMQSSRSLTFWNVSGFSDLYLSLMDPDADVDPYQNLQWILWCLMIKIGFLARKFLNWNYILQHYFSLLNTFMRKGKGSRPVTNGSRRRIRNTDFMYTKNLKFIACQQS